MKIEFKPEPEARYLDGENPEDTASRRESMTEARDKVEVFCRDNFEKLCWLILTYGDARAEERLGQLREAFWAGVSVEMTWEEE